ncbi:MAG TPA: response regulator [Nitrososphaera sp.]|jgi:two-component system response regulator ChvI
MLVDDEADVLNAVEKMLGRIGYVVHSFASPLVAIKHIKNGCPDCMLLISDIRMPSMSGFQFVQYIKELRPDLRVLFISAFEIHKQEWTKVLPSTPVEGFILKPVRISQLEQILQQCCPKTG